MNLTRGEERWEVLPPMRQRRFGGVAVGNTQGKVYVCGGLEKCASDSTACSVEVYDPDSNCWSVSPPMAECRILPAHAVFAGHLYVFGGDNGYRALRCVERMHLQTGKWEELPCMSSARLGMTLAAMCDH